MDNPKDMREQVVRDAKESLILDAARKVFSEKGFHEARLEDIAAQAGFSKASLYNYYEDKESIFLKLAVREHNRLRERIRESTDPAASLTENLKKVLTTVFSMFGEHFSFLLTTSNFQAMNFNTESLWKQNKELVAGFRQSGEEIQKALVSIFEMGRKRGELKTLLDNRTLARYLGSLVRGMLFDWRVQGKMGDIQKEIDSLILFVTKGIEKA